MSGKFLIFLTCILSAAVPNESAKILGLFCDPTKSHVLIHTAVAESLIERGHNVTIVTNVPLDKKNLNYRHIQLDIDEYPKDLVSDMVNKGIPYYKRYYILLHLFAGYANASLNQPIMQKLMEEESFDLVILGYFFNDFHLGVAAHFKCPVVVSFMIQTHRLTNDLIGNPGEIAYVPDIFTKTKQPLNFWERVKNFAYNAVIQEIVIPLVIHRKQEQYYK